MTSSPHTISFGLHNLTNYNGEIDAVILYKRNKTLEIGYASELQIWSSKTPEEHGTEKRVTHPMAFVSIGTLGLDGEVFDDLVGFIPRFSQRPVRRM